MTSKDIPVWLLDVDGVLNATRAGWGRAPLTSRVWSTMAGRDYTIRWEPKVMARIAAIHGAGLAEIRWCTTWCGDTDVIEKTLGLPRLGTCWTEFLRGFFASVAKTDAAKQVIADGRRLIWTDDKEVPHFGPLREELTADGRGLLIRPAERTGLRPGHLDEIDAFVGMTVTTGS